MEKVSFIDLKIPNLGEAESTEIIEVNINAGDKISANDPLIVLESEKAAMEVPSDFSGEITEVLVKDGDLASEGMVFARIKVDAEKLENIPKKETIKSEVDNKQLPGNGISNHEVQQTQVKFTGLNAGPAVRKYIRELAIDVSGLNGTGKGGRITIQNLKDFIYNKISKGIEPQFPSVESISKFGDIKIEPINTVRKSAAKNLHNAWITIPHVFHFENAEMENIDIVRKKLGCSPLPVIIKAVSNTLLKHPLINSSMISPNELVFKDFINIGIAVNTPNGLIVPVIKSTNTLSIADIEIQVKKLSEKARSKKIFNQDLEGATFTISSLGKLGGTRFTPIINPPEVAILGVSNIDQKIVLEDKKIIEKKILPLSLSYDHRVINGVEAGQFMVDLKGELERIE